MCWCCWPTRCLHPAQCYEYIIVLPSLLCAWYHIVFFCPADDTSVLSCCIPCTGFIFCFPSCHLLRTLVDGELFVINLPVALQLDCYLIWLVVITARKTTCLEAGDVYFWPFLPLLLGCSLSSWWLRLRLVSLCPLHEVFGLGVSSFLVFSSTFSLRCNTHHVWHMSWLHNKVVSFKPYKNVLSAHTLPHVCYSESERKEEAKKRLEKRLEKRENT